MPKNRVGVKSFLMDMHYDKPLNSFEEFYGEWISYSEIEQASYIDFKEMVFDMINRDIKFRKYGRLVKGVLTLKVDLLDEEYEQLIRINNQTEIDSDYSLENPGEIRYKKFNFIHDFVISNIRPLTNEEKIRFKKISIDELDEEEIENLDL